MTKKRPEIPPPKTKTERIVYALLMVFGNLLSNAQIADYAGCSERYVLKLKSQFTPQFTPQFRDTQHGYAPDSAKCSPLSSPPSSLNNEVFTPQFRDTPDEHKAHKGNGSPPSSENTEYMLFNNTSKETKRKKDTVRERNPECASFFDWCKDEFFRTLKRKPTWQNFELKNFADFWDGLIEAHDIDTLKKVFQHFLTIQGMTAGHKPTVYAKNFDMYFDSMTGHDKTATPRGPQKAFGRGSS